MSYTKFLICSPHTQNELPNFGKPYHDSNAHRCHLERSTESEEAEVTFLGAPLHLLQVPRPYRAAYLSKFRITSAVPDAKSP